MRITWFRCIPLNFRSKTRQRVTLMLLTLVYVCRLGGTVGFLLPCMTNDDKRYDFDFHIVNFPFLSSNIPDLPAYLLSLSRSSYDMSGLAPCMDCNGCG